jgi:opacity protein-like surface antigen
MKANKLLMLAALAAPLLPMMAHAEQGHIDAYYIPSSTIEIDVEDVGSEDVDGDGFGVKGMIPLGAAQNLFITGEYQSSKFDGENGNADFDVDQLRGGFGFMAPMGTGSLGVYGEYANIDLDGSEADGVGVHGRLVFPIGPAVNLYGQVGYLWLEDDSNNDVDGLEFLVGGSVDFTPNIGAFIDFRQSNLNVNDQDDVDFTFQDVRLGLRVLF